MPDGNVHPATAGALFVRDRTTWAAYLLLGLFAYIQTSLGPAMPFLRERLDLGYTGASLHFSAFAAAVVVSGAAGDRWIARLGRGRALWGGMAGMAVGLAIVGLAPHIAVSLLGALIMGALGTLALMSNQAVLSDLHDERREVALTESNVVATLATIVAPLIMAEARQLASAGRSDCCWRCLFCS